LVSLAVSADSSKLATLSEAGVVQHWSLATDTPLQTFPGHAAGRGRVRWLADNLSVLSGSTDRTVRQVKGSALRSLRIGAGPVTALASAGSQVVVTSADGSVQVADLFGNNPPRRITDGLTLPVVLAARPDGQRLAVGDGTGGIGIWESNGWQRLEQLTLRSAPAALGWSGDGRKLVVATAPSAAGGPSLEVFGPPRAPATASPGKEFVPHQSIETGVAIKALAVDAEGRGTWCLHDDGRLREWGLAALDALRRFDAGSPVLAVAISRDGGTVVSGGNDQSVRVWDPATGQQRAQMTGHAGPVLALALTPDDAMIVSASGDLTLRLWDVSGGRALKQLAATDEAVYSLSVHPAGRTVAAGGADRSIHLYDILGGGIARSLRGHTDFVHAVAFNRQGTRLLSYGYAGVLKIWNPADGTLLHDTVVGRIGNNACWGAAAGGADSGGVPAAVDDRIGVACGDGTVRIVVVPLSAR
jgi:WD40 repeat protein